MKFDRKMKYEPIINTPFNRRLNKHISRIPFNSINMSETLQNRIIDELKQFEEDKTLLIEKRKKQAITYMT